MATSTAARADDRPSLTLTRHLRAPAERVYQAWTQAEALSRWFTPSSTVRIIDVDIDARPGGAYAIRMGDGAGEIHHIRGVYRTLQPFERIAFTWSWISTPERESLVTILLKPAANGTDLTLIHEHFFDAAARDRHEHGWTGCLDGLFAYLNLAQGDAA